MNSEQSLAESRTVQGEEIEKLKRAICKGGSEGQKILLYGLPGVGKTYLLKNVLEQNSEARWRYYHISEMVLPQTNLIYDELQALLLEKQRENQQEVIVFDELDVLYDPALSFSRMKQIMIRLLNQVNIGIVALTNRPNRIPPQILGGFGSKIIINLPNIDLRKEIIEKKLFNIPNELTEEEKNQLYDLTQQYTISDIIVAMQQLAYKPLRKLLNMKSFKKQKDNLYHPCQPEEGQEGVTLLTCDPNQFFFQKIRIQQMKQVLNSIKPSCTPQQSLKMKLFFTNK